MDTLSDLARDPVLIWFEFVPTHKSAINVSSLSPDLCDIIVLKPIICANFITSRVSVTVPIWFNLINIALEDCFKKPTFNLSKFVT